MTILSRTNSPLPNNDRNFLSNSSESFELSSSPFDARISRTFRPKAPPTASQTVSINIEENAPSTSRFEFALVESETNWSLPVGIIELDPRVIVATHAMSGLVRRSWKMNWLQPKLLGRCYNHGARENPSGKTRADTFTSDDLKPRLTACIVSICPEADLNNYSKRQVGWMFTSYNIPFPESCRTAARRCLAVSSRNHFSRSSRLLFRKSPLRNSGTFSASFGVRAAGKAWGPAQRRLRQVRRSCARSDCGLGGLL